MGAVMRGIGDLSSILEREKQGGRRGGSAGWAGKDTQAMKGGGHFHTSGARPEYAGGCRRQSQQCGSAHGLNASINRRLAVSLLR